LERNERKTTEKIKGSNKMAYEEMQSIQKSLQKSEFPKCSESYMFFHKLGTYQGDFAIVSWVFCSFLMTMH
jgi:hypothetical protein